MSEAFHFAGFPQYLATAAERVGRPSAAAPARRITALSAVANLCAQAAEAEVAHIPGILERADEIRMELESAALAARLMIADVRRGRRIGPVSVGDPPARKRRAAQSSALGE